MKDIVKLGGLLMLITAIAATALAGIYGITKPRIDLQKQMALENALTIALPQADKDAIYPIQDDQTGEVLYYRGYESTDTTDLVGYAFVAKEPAYSSVIETMVGVDTTGEIIGLKILDQKETPGLGTRIEEVKYGETEPWFQQQFIDKQADKVAVDKDGGDIQSITGATISSRAVTKSIVSGYEEFLQEKREN